jgi:hypothetical protein
MILVIVFVGYNETACPVKLLREVQVRKLSKALLGRHIVGAGGVFFGGEDAKIRFLTLSSYPGLPISVLTMPTNTAESAFRPLRFTAKRSLVSSIRGEPQVVPSIVEWVSVPVVDRHSVWGPHNSTSKILIPSELGFWVIYPSLHSPCPGFSFVRLPSVAPNQSKVVEINLGDQTPGKRQENNGAHFPVSIVR